MTVTADEKGNLALPMTRPGDRFDVEVSSDGKVVLTKVVVSQSTDAGQTRFVREDGLLVGIAGRPIDSKKVREALDEFP